MSFERVDPTVKAWAEDLGLVLFTEYKDEPVRSVQLVGKRGQRAKSGLIRPESQAMREYTFGITNDADATSPVAWTACAGS
jgi:hypothetical protein